MKFNQKIEEIKKVIKKTPIILATTLASLSSLSAQETKTTKAYNNKDSTQTELSIEQKQDQDFFEETKNLFLRLRFRPDFFKTNDAEYYFGTIGKYDIEVFDRDGDYTFDQNTKLFVAFKDTIGNNYAVSSGGVLGRSGVIFSAKNFDQKNFETILNGDFVSKTGTLISELKGDATKPVSVKWLSHEEQMAILKDVVTALHKID